MSISALVGTGMVEMKKKEMIPKCLAYMWMPDLKNKVKKSAWDVAKEWQKLGKDAIRKMETEEVFVSP